MKGTQERRFEQMMESLDGIELTEEEKKTLFWIAGWEESSVNNMDDIFKKCREQK